MEDYRAIIGENIRRQRKRRHMTQEDLADLTGMQPSCVGKNRAGPGQSKSKYPPARCGCVGSGFAGIVGSSILREDERVSAQCLFASASGAEPFCRPGAATDSERCCKYRIGQQLCPIPGGAGSSFDPPQLL